MKKVGFMRAVNEHRGRCRVTTIQLQPRPRGRLEDVPGCVGLVVDLDTVWATVDRLSSEET